MKGLEFALVAGKFGGHESGPRIGKEGPVGEGDAEGSTHGPQMRHHPVDVLLPEPRGHGHALRRCLGMDLHAQPLDSKIELLPQLFDDALADITERSDVVRKDANTDGHGTSFLSIIIADTETAWEGRAPTPGDGFAGLLISFLMLFRHGTEGPFRQSCGLTVERPVEPPAEVGLGNLGHQLHELGAGEMFLQLFEQSVADLGRRLRHGDSQVEHHFFEQGESAALAVMGKLPELLFGDPLCSALGRA